MNAQRQLLVHSAAAHVEAEANTRLARQEADHLHSQSIDNSSNYYRSTNGFRNKYEKTLKQINQ
jgi:hypothetical protein